MRPYVLLIDTEDKKERIIRDNNQVLLTGMLRVRLFMSPFIKSSLEKDTLYVIQLSDMVYNVTFPA